MANQTHESYSRHEPAVPSSDRSFGMVMAAAFALLTLINMWHFGPSGWTGALAVVFRRLPLSGHAQAAQSDLVQVRPFAAQGGEPHRDGLGVLRHRAADRPHHAGAGQGPATAQMAARRE